MVLSTGLGVLPPGCILGVIRPFAARHAAGCLLGLADPRLLGGDGLSILGISSSSLDDETFSFDRRLFGSSLFMGSSIIAGGDLGMGMLMTATGVSEADDSVSELLEPEPELVEEVPLLLESDVEPELLSVLLLLT